MIPEILTRTAILALVSTLPLRSAHKVAGYAGRSALWPGVTRKWSPVRTAISSRLGLPAGDTDALVAAVFERSAMQQLEGGVFRFKPRQTIESLVDIRGREHLDAALARGRGCILYSGHFRGNWTFFAALGLLGYHPIVIRQGMPPVASRSTAWFQSEFSRVMSTKFDCETIWTSPFVGALAAAHLRQNGIVVNLIDIGTYTRHVADVDFFGRTEKFPIGTTVLAQKAQAPLIDFSVSYDASTSRYNAMLGVPHETANDTRQATQELASRLEARIRRDPKDWAGWEKRPYIGT